MNSNNAKLYLPLVRALVDGKQLEVQDALGNWEVASEVSFTKGHDRYRIKQEPKEIWVICDSRNENYGYRTSRAAAYTALDYFNRTVPSFAPFTAHHLVEQL